MNTAEACFVLAGMATDDWLRDHHCRTGIIFTAFAIEAMFIFYRKQVDPDYDKKKTECRKVMHKTTLALCGINNYMGKKPYQIVKDCLEVRDAIAHGDSYTSSFSFSTGHLDNQDDITRDIISVSSEQFRELTLERLEKYIEMAKNIDHNFYDNGYRLSEKDLPPGERRKLMLAFGVSGVSMWSGA
ncbi:hypothetical protein ACOAKA_07105 [Escherichia coli]|uniref:hypothetical protein n=2 Tax=Enterobacterales TaxID=91347 RepID=UPI00067DAF59|nr:hypothetical protein [Escherichia coli]